MDLIPLPQEEISPQKAKKVAKIRQLLSTKTLAHNDKVLIKSCEKLTEYLTSGKNISISELDVLIKNLQRTVLSLQKHKTAKLHRQQSKKPRNNR